MLDLHRLRLLHGFATHGTIVATAVASGYSASAVSQHLAALEREAGVALFERSARSAQLTPLGERLASHAAAILAQVETAESDLAAHVATPVGRVVVATPPTAAVALAPGLARARARHRGIEIVVRQAAPRAALDGLRAREIDVAVIDEWGPARLGLEGHFFATDALLRDEVVVAVPSSHPAALDTPVDRAALDALRDQPWICAPHGEPSRDAFDALLGGGIGGPVSRWEFEGLATIAELVAQGAGLALLPRLAIGTHLLAAVAIRPLEPPLDRSLAAITRAAGRPRPAIDVVVAAMAAALRRHGPNG